MNRSRSQTFPILLILPLSVMAWPVEVGAAQLNLTWTDNSDNEASYVDSGLTGGTTYWPLLLRV